MKGPQTVRLLCGFGRSAHTRGWAVLDGLRSKELNSKNGCLMRSVMRVIDHMFTFPGMCSKHKFL